MAHEITRTDSLTLAERPAWHGLGVVLPEAPTVDEALRPLDWTVERERLYRILPFGGGPEAVPAYATVRSDTDETLGVVGESYRVLQNRELAALVSALAQGRGGVEVESAGSLRGGRDVFFLARTRSIVLPGEDVVRQYVLLHNSHDGRGRFRALPTSVRVVCRNTARAALASKEGVELLHRENLADNVEKARERILGLERDFLTQERAIRDLVARELDGPRLRELFAAVWERVNDRAVPDPAKAEDARARARFIDDVARWLGGFETAAAEQAGPGAYNAWLALNSATEDLEHGQGTRLRATTDRQHSRLLGTISDKVARAWEGALATL